MNDFERIAYIFNELASDNSRNFKKDLLNQRKDDTQLALVFRLAYDPYIKFNVARVVLTEGFRSYGSGEYTFDRFIRDLEILINREKTGNEALDFVQMIYYNLPESFQPYLEKILQKDLKIGVSTATINETWPEWIPEFKLGLCERWKKVKSVKYPMFAERKVDGVRVIAFLIPELKKVEMISRSGLPYNNFKKIEWDLLNSDYGSVFFDRSRIDQVGIVLDGEIIDGDFQGIMNNARRLYDVDCNSAIFHVWDMIYGDEFFSETCSMPLDHRKSGLDCVLFPYEGNVKVMDYTTINSHDELLQCFQKFYFEEGYEGVILKDPKSMYIYSSGSKRGKAWLKYKIQDYNKENGNEGISEYSVTVTGYYPGEPNTRLKDVLGGFSYKGLALLRSGIQVEIQGRCGGGYSDDQRIDFWNRRDQLVGSIIDVESQEVTSNKEGTYSLRFPVFKRFRLDLIKESSN